MTSLSPEPWEFPPEPQIWQPPPPPKRTSPLAYVLLGGSVVALAAIALAIIFWPGSSSNGSGQPQSATTAPGQPPASANPQSEQSGNAGPRLNQQAGQVDAVLTEMAGTRADLGSAVTGGCQTEALTQIRSQREEQLAKTKSLQVDALESGEELRNALVRALEASIESNQQYIDTAPGCPTDAEVSEANGRASEAKNEFIGFWRPNAEQAGLDVRSPDQI